MLIKYKNVGKCIKYVKFSTGHLSVDQLNLNFLPHLFLLIELRSSKEAKEQTKANKTALARQAEGQRG